VGNPQGHREADAGRGGQAQRHIGTQTQRHRTRTLRANGRGIPTADEGAPLARACLGSQQAITADGSCVGGRCSPNRAGRPRRPICRSGFASMRGYPVRRKVRRENPRSASLASQHRPQTGGR
jgi:hypothetical protein